MTTITFDFMLIHPISSFYIMTGNYTTKMNDWNFIAALLDTSFYKETRENLMGKTAILFLV